MQENILQIVNNATDNTVKTDFRRLIESENRTVYMSPVHEIGKRETLTLQRSPVVSTGRFRGTRKVSAKFTKDSAVLDSTGAELIAPALGEISFSLPVGLADSERLLLISRMADLLTNAMIESFTKVQEI